MSNVTEHLSDDSDAGRPLHRVLHEVRIRSALIRKQLARGQITPEQAEEQLEQLRSASKQQNHWMSRIFCR